MTKQLSRAGSHRTSASLPRLSWEPIILPCCNGLELFRAAGHKFSAWGLCRDAFPLVELDVSPVGIVDLALRSGCRSITYAHTEPTIFYELARDTMEEAKKAGLLNVFVTNGYMTREMLNDSRTDRCSQCGSLGLQHRFYDEYFDARLDGIKDSLCYMRQLGIWLEVTTIVIPKLNDDPVEIREMARFIRKELGAENTMAYRALYSSPHGVGHTAYGCGGCPQARQLALDEGLHHVYVKNMPEKKLWPHTVQDVPRP